MLSLSAHFPYSCPFHCAGPAAYAVKDDMIHCQPPVSVFGTSRRENEANRYISSLHNATVPPSDTPGPGTYRCNQCNPPYCSPEEQVQGHFHDAHQLMHDKGVKSYLLK